MASLRTEIQLPPELLKQLQAVAPKIQRQIFKTGLREWAKATRAAVRANLTVNDKALKASVTIQTKTFNKGTTIRVRVGCKNNATGPATNPGLRSSFFEGGFRPWSKGESSGRKGRGWRKGLKGSKLAGTKIHATRFMKRAQEQTKHLIIPNIIAAMNAAIAKVGTGHVK